MSVRRLCTGCGEDQTPLGRGLASLTNARGIGLGLYCETCLPLVRAAVAAVDRRHGAVITPDGCYLASPRGTPHDPAAYALPRPA